MQIVERSKRLNDHLLFSVSSPVPVQCSIWIAASKQPYRVGLALLRIRGLSICFIDMNVLICGVCFNYFHSYLH